MILLLQRLLSLMKLQHSLFLLLNEPIVVLLLLLLHDLFVHVLFLFLDQCLLLPFLFLLNFLQPYMFLLSFIVSHITLFHLNHSRFSPHQHLFIPPLDFFPFFFSSLAEIISFLLSQLLFLINLIRHILGFVSFFLQYSLQLFSLLQLLLN